MIQYLEIKPTKNLRFDQTGQITARF
jgi:hypothetical protein